MSFVRVPPDGAGKKVFTKSHVVGADNVEAQVLHLADGADPRYLQSVDIRGSASVRFAEGQPIMAGFGQLKVQEDHPLGVYESSISNYSELFSTVMLGGGQSIYDSAASSMRLVVDGANGSRAMRTTNRYHYYLPGSANFVKMTVGLSDNGKEGNVRRWGAFDDSDGVFFELDGTQLYAVIRSSTTGEITNTRVRIQDWTVDQLDGDSPSGHVLDLSKINVWWIDYQWLGAGRVRFGIFEPNGARLVCHEFYNAGSITLPYMRSGTLPLRTENLNTAATGSTSELREVCLAMYTEGNYEDFAFWRCSAVDADLTVTGADQHLFSLRPKTLLHGKHNGAVVYPETLNLHVSGGAVSVSLYQATDVTGGNWVDLPAAIDYSTDCAVDVTDKRRYLTRFFGPGTHTVDLAAHFELNDNAVHLRADGTPEHWTFLISKLDAADAQVTANLCFRELW
jgi:hypothetical protein